MASAHELSRGGQRAMVSDIGAAVRSYTVDGIEVLTSQLSDDDARHAGVVLAPWPNRLADGAYEFEGNRYQLPINEPERRNALHGLVQSRRWATMEATPVSATFRTLLTDPATYPFDLELTVKYALTSDGLTVRFHAINRGVAGVPFAIGFHPYVAVGSTEIVDGCTLQLAATSRLVTDDRLLPVNVVPVAGTSYDFTAKQLLTGHRLDTTFVARPTDGSSVVGVQVGRCDGYHVDIWADYPTFSFWHIYTTDGSAPGRSIAVEPMTAPPNALNTLGPSSVLPAGSSLGGSWGARLTR